MRYKNQRLSSEDLLLIRKLTDEGKSLNYLSKLMDLGKPTIYYQVRKFKPRIKKDFVVNLKDFQIGELIGAFAGDGNYHHKKYDKLNPKKSCSHRISYFLSFSREQDYAQHINNLLMQLNLNPNIINRDQSVSIVIVKSLEYVNFIKNYLTWDEDKTFTIRLRDKFSKYSDDFLKGFARGLMDTDGFLNPSNAVCACISIRLIDNLHEIFTRLGLETTRTTLVRGGNTRPLHFVRVRRRSLEDYRKLIGFSSMNKINKLNEILG